MANDLNRLGVSYDPRNSYRKTESRSSSSTNSSRYEGVYIYQNNGAFNDGSINNGYNSDNQGSILSNPRPFSPTRTKNKCTLCDGKGTVVSSSGASFGQDKWCSECGKRVPSDHYHGTCPSCKGKGEW